MGTVDKQQYIAYIDMYVVQSQQQLIGLTC